VLSGEVAEVQEVWMQAARRRQTLRDELFLPQVDRAVVRAIGGLRQGSPGQASGSSRRRRPPPASAAPTLASRAQRSRCASCAWPMDWAARPSFFWRRGG